MYGDGVPAASNGAASDSPMTGSGYTDQLATTRPHMWAGPGVPGPASSGDIERLRDDLNRFIERVMPLVELAEKLVNQNVSKTERLRAVFGKR